MIFRQDCQDLKDWVTLKKILSFLHAEAKLSETLLFLPGTPELPISPCFRNLKRQ